MKQKTLSQQRAEYALQKVNENGKADGFKNFSAGAPSMILQNGFGQSLAFWAAKGKGNNNEKHTVVLNIVLEWLKKEKLIQSSEANSFFSELNNLSQEVYFAAQTESIAVLEWVKRYANAFCKD